MANNRGVRIESINSSESDNENDKNNGTGARSKLQKNKKRPPTQVRERSKCVPMNEPTLPPDLERIHHKPIYELPILTNEKYRHFDVRQRASLMSDYLTKISNIRANLARQSLLMAPQPRPILSSTKCTDSLMRNGTIIEDLTQIDEDQEDGDGDSQTKGLYVSRFGRPTKRKVYTEEDPDIDKIFETTNNENNGQYDGDDDLKITLPSVIVEEEPPPQSPSKDEVVGKNYTPLKARKRLPRADRLFENLKKEDEKRKERAAEMEAFERTLSQADEDFNENRNNNGTQQEDYDARNPASLRRKKRRSVTSLQEDLDAITVIPGSPIKSEESPKAKKVKDTKARKKETECPICNCKFPTNEVEEHAATCGEIPQES